MFRTHYFSGAPRQDDEDSDQRDVGITIGPRLIADLHQSDHRHQRAQVPKPSDCEVRMTRQQAPGGKGNRSEQERVAGDFPRGQLHWTRVKGGQARGPEHLGEIGNIRDDRVRDARTHGHAFDGDDRASPALDQICDDAGRGGKREERDFFEKEFPRAHAWGYIG